MEFKISRGAILPNQKRIVAEGAFFGIVWTRLSFATDDSILDGPKLRVSVPALKVFAVEERFVFGDSN